MSEVSGKIGAIYMSSGGTQLFERITLNGSGIQTLANPNVWVNALYTDDTGTHTGAADQAVLTDAGATWTINALVGRTIYNTTDNSSGTIISNTADTITATLSGGTDDDWDNGDAYSVAGTLVDEALYSYTIVGEITCVSQANNVVHIDYTYYTVAQVAGFFNWTLDIVGEALETTDFGSDGHRAYIPGIQGWSGSADRHFITTLNMADYVGSKYIIRFYMKTTTTKYRYQGWAYVTGIHLTTPVDALVTEPLDFQGVRTIDYVSGV